MWYIYLLLNSKNDRTYVGSTTDPDRRLRQHNREITGGAKATSKGAPHWKLAVVVGGFSGRSPACRWEAIVKKRARGYWHRRTAMFEVATGRCPRGSRRSRDYRPPSGLVFSAYEVFNWPDSPVSG